MTEEERKAHAKRLIEWHNDEYEYALVYEDEDLEDASEEDWQAIHKLMYTAKLAISWGEDD